MKTLSVLLISILTAAQLYSQSMTLTFEDSDIPTSLNSYDPACNGPLTTLQFSLPAGNPWEITGVDIEYSMTAQGGGWKSHQRSQIYCQNSEMAETSIYEGSGNSGGIQAYSRNGVSIANGVYPAGTELIFEMRAWRTAQGSDCNVTYNKVNNFTWIMTVYYQAVPDDGQIGIGTTMPDSSAILELKSLQKGFLPPRMSTTFRDAIAEPSEGLLIYCTDCAPKGIYIYDGSSWQHASGTGLKDADGDTYVTVEQNPDEDKIRMFTDSIERMTIDSNGNIGLGTNTPDYTLHILGKGNRSISIIDTSETTGERYGVHVEQGSASEGDQYGLYTLLNSTNHSHHVGITNKLTGSGSGQHIGIRNVFSGDGAGTTVGAWTSMIHNGNGIHAGALNNIEGDGIGPHYGVVNTINGSGDTPRFGMYNSISANAGNSNNYAIYNYIDGAGTGEKYGLINVMESIGAGIQYGVSNVITSQMGNIHDHEGVQNNLTANGSGDHYGTKNQLTGVGNGTQYGTLNEITNSGPAHHYGTYNKLSGNGTGWHFGVYNELNSTASDFQFGTYTAMTGEGSGALYGSETYINANNPSSIRGLNAYVAGTGNGDKYGVYVDVPGWSGGVKYAGYFNGDVTVLGTFNNPSDQKFKTHITPLLHSSSLEKLKAIRIYQYQYDLETYPFMSFPATTQTGVIAQELQEIFPELVKTNIHPSHEPLNENDDRASNPEVEYLGVDYIGLIPHLISAIQELHQNYEELKEENLQQQALIEELRKR